MRREGVAFPVTLLILGLAWCAPGPVAAQTADEELLSLTGAQPALAADVRGGFAVIWVDTEAENEGLGIRGCLLAPKDKGCGPHFAVNTTAIGDQLHPAVAADDPGRFVVAWQGRIAEAEGSAGTAIFGQRFGAGGVKLGPELVLARPEEGSLLAPKLALGDDGTFVVAWQSEQNGRTGVEAARFSVKGKPLGPVIAMEAEGEVNRDPAVAFEAGGFEVSWRESSERPGDSAEPSTAIARFDREGRAAGKVERSAGIAALLSGDAACNEDRCETVVAVARDGRGRRVAVWEVSERGTGWRLFVQLFSAAGKPRTERLPVNAIFSQAPESPAVALADDGAVLIAWSRTDALHPEQTGLYLRRLRVK